MEVTAPLPQAAHGQTLRCKLVKDVPQTIEGHTGDVGFRLEINQTWAKKGKKGETKKYIEALKVEMSFNVPRDVFMEKVDLYVKTVANHHRHVMVNLQQTEETKKESVAYHWGMGDCSRLHQYPFHGKVLFHPILYTKESGKDHTYQLPKLQLVLVSKEDMGQPKQSSKVADYPTEQEYLFDFRPENASLSMELLQYALLENLTTLDVCRGAPPETVNFCGEQYVVYENTDGLHLVVDGPVVLRTVVQQRYRTDIQLAQGDNLIRHDYIFQNPQFIIIGFSKEDLLIISTNSYDPQPPAIVRKGPASWNGKEMETLSLAED